MAARPPTFTPSRAPHPSRAARHAPPPERSRLKRVLRWALWLIVPMLAVIAGSLVGLVYAFAKVPVLDQVPAAQTTVFLDRKGAEIGTLSPSENRRIVPLSDIPRGMQRATLADVRRAGVSQGGSTITQQYVKNAYPNVGRRRNLFRKLKETVIAVKLEKRYSKEQILGFYLNTVYFGKGAYGVDAASRVFFGHPARKLTTTESALLAATIRAPEFYSKKQNAISAKARRNYVLQIMRDRGWITPKQAAAATRAPVRERWTVKPTGIPHSKAPYFLEKVRQYLLDKYGPGRLAQDGFRVRTTIDMGMQRQAGLAVKGVLGRPGDPRASLVALDPRTGAVRAMYGGRNFAKEPFNYATDAMRQAGSTMKPFVLQDGRYSPGRKPQLTPVVPLALGASDVSTLQHASAYGTWADQGVHHQTYLVEQVTDSSGRVLERHQDAGRQVIDPNIANTVTLALRGVVEDGTGTRARLPDRMVAGKTGTTSDSVDA